MTSGVLRPARLPSFTRAIADFVFPPLCSICGVRLIRAESVLCDPCRDAALPIPSWRCPYCGATGDATAPEPGDRCPFCPPLEAPYRGVLSAAPYRTEAAQCVRLFKYHRRLEVGRLMGHMMVARLAEPVLALEDRVGWVVPVPLHWRRRAWRGFNQSALLARQLSRATSLPMKTNLLRRVRATRMQVRVPAHRRAENVRGAFSLSRRPELPLPGILLVDDVVTGGHTVSECARVLTLAGAPEIWVASYARALPRRVEMTP